MGDSTTKTAADSDAWAPLRRPVFRSLWIALLVSNVGTWMQSMAAAWLMTELTHSAAQVALVQAAQSLPLFLLALPAGALADIVDRRRQLIAAQVWMLASAGVLTATTFAGLITPAWLLIATFLIGCGAAATIPAFSASIQELVPRAELQAAVALNGLSINVSRAVGPALAGLIVVWSGTVMVFLLNTLSFLGVILALRAWKRLPTPAAMPAERLWGALRTGYRYARHAPVLQRVLLRALAFFPFASAIWALLPLVASRELAGDAKLFGILLGCIGTGAVATALLLPRLTRRIPRDRLVALATLTYAAAVAAIGLLPNAWTTGLALLVVGGAWMAVLSSLQLAVQTALPPWVRGRGLALYWVVLMGSMAAGSMGWGQVAEWVGVREGLVAAAVAGALVAVVTLRLRIGGHEDLDLSPSMHWPVPTPAAEPELDAGPALVTVEYRIRAQNAARFLKAMRTVRRMRLRDGASYWQIFRDTEDPERFVEHFLTESWGEHLRQHGRVTKVDREIQARIQTLHTGHSPPKVTHYIAAGARVRPFPTESQPVL